MGRYASWGVDGMEVGRGNFDVVLAGVFIAGFGFRGFGVSWVWGFVVSWGFVLNITGVPLYL